MSVTPVTVEEELRKNPELKQEVLDGLKEWLHKQPHLPTVPDLELILFLHSCYWSPERAKQTIDTYYTIRTHIPEVFTCRDPSHPTVTGPMDVVNCLFIRNQNNPDEVAFYGKLRNTDSSAFIFLECLKYCVSVQDIALQEYGTFGKFIIILDVEGMTLGHLTKLEIGLIKKLLMYLQEAIPVRLKDVHFIHPVPFMDKLMMLLRPFLKAELAAMIHIHPQLETFLRLLDPTLLPRDIGGEAPSIDDIHKLWMEKVKGSREYFLGEEQRRVVEGRRAGRARGAGEVFGLEGSFKRLDID